MIQYDFKNPSHISMKVGITSYLVAFYKYLRRNVDKWDQMSINFDQSFLYLPENPINKINKRNQENWAAIRCGPRWKKMDWKLN
jgi:hypothetical protein